MNRIAVVTDSAAALPTELVEKHHIHVVPLLLLWDGQTYQGADITPGEVYRRLRGTRSLPHTASPSVGDFIRAYTRLGSEEGACGWTAISLPTRNGWPAALQRRNRTRG